MRWKPRWELEGRTPAFIGDGPLHPFGSTKYFWGNVPALDVLRLNSNEGEGYERELRLLFAGAPETLGNPMLVVLLMAV